MKTNIMSTAESLKKSLTFEESKTNKPIIRDNSKDMLQHVQNADWGI